MVAPMHPSRSRTQHSIAYRKDSSDHHKAFDCSLKTISPGLDQGEGNKKVDCSLMVEIAS